MTVRTRIAPSPTGAPHIGTAYMALFNYAFARRHGGQFILRIEDTDQVRSTRESEAQILDALRWLGLTWDEGPDVGGAVGPYRQSERSAVYRRYADQLVADGKAYPCFCSADRLAQMRAARQTDGDGNSGYDGLCAGLDPADAARRCESGEPHVIRLRVPKDGDCTVCDRLRDPIRIPWQKVDHQVLVKTDGFPTYHLANVVDDHLMKITHVIRGEEWISSAPKHLLLYQAFGWDPPELIHLPLLRNPDKSKLSKRKNPTGIDYYRRAGYLPETMCNFLGLMAYSLPDGREQFSLEEWVESFDIDRVSLGGPVFDVEKLTDFNGRYLRALGTEALYHRFQAWMLNEQTWRQILPLAQPRLSKLTDLMPLCWPVFADRIAVPAADVLAAVDRPERAAELLRLAQWEFERLTIWDKDTVQGVFASLAEHEGLKLKQLTALFYPALAGSKVALPLFDSLALMGREICIRRLHYALEALEADGVGLKGKALKRLTKDYEVRYGRRD